MISGKIDAKNKIGFIYDGNKYEHPKMQLIAFHKTNKIINATEYGAGNPFKGHRYHGLYKTGNKYYCYSITQYEESPGCNQWRFDDLKIINQNEAMDIYNTGFGWLHIEMNNKLLSFQETFKL